MLQCHLRYIAVSRSHGLYNLTCLLTLVLFLPKPVEVFLEIVSSNSPGYQRQRQTSSLFSLERRHLRVDLVVTFNIFKGTYTHFCMAKAVFDEGSGLYCACVMSSSMFVSGPKSFLKDLWNVGSPSTIFFTIMIGIPALIVNRKNTLAFRK